MKKKVFFKKLKIYKYWDSRDRNDKKRIATFYLNIKMIFIESKIFD